MINRDLILLKINPVRGELKCFQENIVVDFFVILGPRRDVDELGPILLQLGSDFRINFNIN